MKSTPWTMPIAGTALKSVVRLSTEQTSSSRKDTASGGEGVRGMVTRRLTGEQMVMMEVKGQGTCYFADRASEINLVSLHGDKLYVESSNLLCTDAGLRTGTTFTGLRGGATGNGLFTT